MMNANAVVGKAQDLLLRIGIDDKLTAFLLLGCGVALFANAVWGHKKAKITVDSVGSTALNEAGING
jgi:hypothetical protein